ncbi:cellulose biosynthesis protein BcsD [Novosphingobium sp.]|uniref:cellulose biosynthesis protein BcsD n=1 Tax=Novosphingobium sp. TaxID=1874826 RepID=UPI003569D655|nr:hypothetical protein [Novosphingobium sp.]
MPLTATSSALNVHGVPILLAQIVAELSDVAPASQIESFVFALGQRLATRVYLNDAASLAELEDQVNLLWRELGIGRSRMAADVTAIVVHHDPGHLPADVIEPQARPYLAELLRGTFDACFRRLGSSEKTQTTAHWVKQMIEIRHGS